MTISFAIAMLMNSWWHVLVAACIAPLLLLRTKLSTRLGIAMFVKWSEALRSWMQCHKIPLICVLIGVATGLYVAVALVAGSAAKATLGLLVLAALPLAVIGGLVSKPRQKLAALFLIPGFALLLVLGRGLDALPWLLLYLLAVLFGIGIGLGRDPVTALVSRVWATGTGVYWYRWRAIHEIPRNWGRICLCTDFWHPPEIVPGVELSVQGANHRVASVAREVRPQSRIRLLQRFDQIGLWVILGTYYLSSYTYRLSIKSTSVVWLPLLWVVRKPGAVDSLHAQLVEICNTAWERFKRRCAWGVLIVLFLVPIALSFLWQYVSQKLQGVDRVTYLLPTCIFGTYCVSAGLTLAIYYYADRVRVRQDANLPINANHALNLLVFLRRLRWLFTVFSISSTLLFVATRVRLSS